MTSKKTCSPSGGDGEVEAAEDDAEPLHELEAAALYLGRQGDRPDGEVWPAGAGVEAGLGNGLRIEAGGGEALSDALLLVRQERPSPALAPSLNLLDTTVSYEETETEILREGSLPMLHFFLNTVGRKCENVACGMRGRQVGRQVELCEACQRPLTPVRRLDWRKTGLAAAIAVVLVTGLSYLTQLYLQKRAAEQTALRLAQAIARFQNSLRGATTSDVEAVLRSVQAELQLTEDEKQRVLKASRQVVDRLPRVLTADVQQRLELLVRDLYEDGRLSANDRSALDRFTREHRLAPQAVQTFEEKLTGRLDESYRGISQGHSLAEQGKHEEARLALSRATQIDPGNAMAWADLGVLHGLLGQSLEARSCYDKALSLDPENWLAHYNLGILTARSGDHEGAFQHLRQGLSNLPAGASQEYREMVDGLLREPDLEELRRDPRFADLLGGGEARGTAS